MRTVWLDCGAMESAEPSPAAAEDTPLVTTVGEILRPALLLWLATHVLFGLQAQFWAFTWSPRTSTSVYLFAYEVVYLVFCALVLKFVWRDVDARRVFARPRPRMTELCLLVGVVAAMILWAWETRIPSGWAPPSPTALEHDAEWPLFLSLLATAVLPALFEEWMYRGLLLQRFRRVLPLELAIGLQAMLFALMHIDPVMLLPHFVFAVVAGILRTAAGALWPCMLMHLLWNGAVVLSVYEVL